MARKYILVSDKDTNATGLYRLKALKDFNNVKQGDLGGFVDKKTNLSHDGNCWVYDNAIVKNSTISNNALIRDTAIVIDSHICDDVIILNNARVTSSEIRGKVLIHEAPNITKSEITNNVVISGCVQLINDSIRDNCRIEGDCPISHCSFNGNVKINNYQSLKSVTAYGNISIQGCVLINAFVHLYDNAELNGSFEIHTDIEINHDAIIHSKKDFIIFKNWWSSGRNFIWTRSNNMWQVGCFHGTGKELIKKAYLDSKLSGHEYQRVVNYVEDILDEDKPKLVRLFNHIKRSIKLFI